MSKGNGDMLGVGGTRSKLSRGALRGGAGGGRGGTDRGRAQAQRQELLRKFQERATGKG
ncbi:hypothetical protein HEK616_12150 [Streptomyces nigrescens]|uniref:Uncharacterized protein n=2 Tax=Streptomyces TaxID=1883 RepID=A0ABM7ZN44_STRNI|nr:DUF6243 family protein [Streptomyces nigrescens]MEE4425222.1 DUF6243 family protein [Streptomyces sp. DSM 41528]BDM67728.1 hypothetical protein HEK616_12150 [Streptomyces nigrescens]